MTHRIEFRWLVLADVDRPEYSYPQRVVIKEGTRMAATLKPYVSESPEGPVEVADLQFEAGSRARAVLYAASRFLDGQKARKH